MDNNATHISNPNKLREFLNNNRRAFHIAFVVRGIITLPEHIDTEVVNNTTIIHGTFLELSNNPTLCEYPKTELITIIQTKNGDLGTPTRLRLMATEDNTLEIMGQETDTETFTLEQIVLRPIADYWPSYLSDKLELIDKSYAIDQYSKLYEQLIDTDSKPISATVTYLVCFVLVVLGAIAVLSTQHHIAIFLATVITTTLCVECMIGRIVENNRYIISKQELRNRLKLLASNNTSNA
jgi:hypothetical protein